MTIALKKLETLKTLTQLEEKHSELFKQHKKTERVDDSGSVNYAIHYLDDSIILALNWFELKNKFKVITI